MPLRHEVQFLRERARRLREIAASHTTALSRRLREIAASHTTALSGQLRQMAQELEARADEIEQETGGSASGR